MSRPTAAMNQLRKALQLLAADADVQERHLRELGSWPSLDELALEFDDIDGTASTAVQEGLIATEAAGRIGELSNLLESMSGPDNQALWLDSAIQTSREWAAVRESAKRALAVFEPAHAV